MSLHKIPPQITVDVLVYMIESDLEKYHCDPWYKSPGDTHFFSLEKMGVDNSQIKYRGAQFFVVRHHGTRGMGGMNEGTPRSYTIYKLEGDN